MITMADTDTHTLIEWLLDILKDPEAREALLDDPNGYLNQCGWGDADAGDIEDALRLIHHDDDDDHGDHGDDDDDDRGNHHPAPHHHHDNEDAGTYLRNYVTNNYTYVDDRDTEVDNSVHQRIDTDGGDFDQTIDNDPVVASGDGAVAAGHDIRDSTVTTGDGNVVGNGNQAVTGDDNTTAFGQGDATDANFSDARFGDGSGVSLGGNATGHSEDNDTSTSVRGGDGATSVNASGDHGYANQYADQSHTDNSSDDDYENHTRIEDHSEHGSHNHSETDIDTHVH
jgi:hypothetical protein